ncbi:MAG: hypothetical protein K9N06_01365 [Candidatus Cloacimonetes bacterium]|nr:hypothetical protein [Candidatus Cloacimonadota bacterium]
MKYLILILLALFVFSCAVPPFTVYQERTSDNQRPLAYDSSEIPTVFTSNEETLTMDVALHSREFPNGILWTISLKAPEDVILPLKMFAYQEERAYELIRLQSDQSYPNYAYYVLPPDLLKNCRFSEELTLSVNIDGRNWEKISNEGYVENFGMFYSFVTIDIKRNTSIIFIH